MFRGRKGHEGAGVYCFDKVFLTQRSEEKTSRRGKVNGKDDAVKVNGNKTR